MSRRNHDQLKKSRRYFPVEHATGHTHHEGDFWFHHGKASSASRRSELPGVFSLMKRGFELTTDFMPVLHFLDFLR